MIWRWYIFGRIRTGEQTPLGYGHFTPFYMEMPACSWWFRFRMKIILGSKWERIPAP